MNLKLLLYPDGRSILVAPPDLTSREVADIRRAWDRWRDTPDGMVILTGEVEYPKTVEIDLPEPEGVTA